MASFTAYPSNKLYVIVLLKIPDDTDPREFILLDDTMGFTPEGFLATSKADNATAVGSLSGNLIYTGVPGIWYFMLGTALMTFATLDAAFASTPPVLIVTIPLVSRQVSEGAYREFREAA